MAYTNLIRKRASELRWYYKNKDKIRSYKRRIRYPYYVMDFDHVVINSKKETVNKLAGERAGWLTLKREIEKCDVVCANCHRMRTYNRRLQQQIKQD